MVLVDVGRAANLERRRLSAIQTTQGSEDVGKESDEGIEDSVAFKASEDDLYWSRLMQEVESMSMPTPAPLQCGMEIDLTCRSRADANILCEDMPRPSTTECTDNTGLEFIYNNCTCECSDNDQEAFTCVDDETCVTEEAMLVTCIGEGEVFCNCTVIEGERVIISAIILPDQLTCSITNPTTGQVCQELIFDPTGNTAKLELGDKFGSLTVAQCTGDEELNCVPEIEYLYTVTNNGPTDLEVTSLVRTCDGDVRSLENAVGGIIPAGLAGGLIEPSFIDVCRANPIEKTVRITADSTEAGYGPCEADDELTIPAPSFLPDFAAPPPSATPAVPDPVEPPVSSPTIGSRPSEPTILATTNPPSGEDTSPNTTPPTIDSAPDPPSTIVVLPPSTIDIDPSEPSGESRDEGVSTLEPQPLADCHLNLRTTCRSDDSRPGDCSWIFPVVQRSHSQASRVTFRYKGGSCSNTSPFHRITCNDYEGGAPTEIGTETLVKITDASGLELFNDKVAVGDTITIEPNLSHDMSAGEYSDADATFTISTQDGKTVLQTFEFESGCWHNLYLSDRFASMDIAGFTVGEGDDAVTSSYFYEAEFTYELTNISEEGDIVVSTLEVDMGDLGKFDITDQISSPIGPNESVTAMKNITIDLSSRTRHQSNAFARGTMVGATECLNGDFYSFGPETHRK